MNIYFIARGWPTEEYAQLGCFERDQAIALRDLGHRVFFLYLDIRSKFGSKKLGITKEEKDGVIIYSLFAGSRWAERLKAFSPKLQYKTVEALFVRLYKSVVKREGAPDILYGHYLRYCRRALAIKRKFGVPAVGIEHWSELGYANIKESIRQQAAEIYPYMDRQLVVSEALRENILKNIGVETTVVHDTIGKEFFYKERIEHDEMVRFVLTGNLIPRKRFDLVLRALGKIAPINSIRCTIIGDGPEKQKLCNLIDEYHLQDIVSLVGRKQRDYIVNTLHESDVYILSSFSETFGVSPVEALACGLPVIATDCGGSRSYMNDFNGLLIPVDDVKAMSDAILYMIDHYKDYDRKRIAEDCRQRFSLEAIGKQLEGIFEDVVRSQKTCSKN